MAYLDDLIGIRFRDYKCYRDASFEISLRNKITLVIGKNNSGKSSLVDMVNDVNELIEGKTYRCEDMSLIVTISEECIEYSLDKIKNSSHECDYNFARTLIGIPIYLDTDDSQTLKLSMKYQSTEFMKIVGNQLTARNEWKNIGKYYQDVLSKNIYAYRLNAERDIISEPDESKVYIEANGDGATNLVLETLKNELVDSNVIKETLLQALNKIVYPDASFSDISILQVESYTGADDDWEISLVENGNEYVLSEGGSGLKTIILVLLYIIVLPELHGDTGLIFIFEELENNLHPSLQRRLYEFLYEYSQDKCFRIFMTTHSPVAINSFYGRNGTLIYHIEKQNDVSTFKEIRENQECRKILDDLGVHASDILQSNGIIWVEGPSDRIYINKWLEVFCDNEYAEGFNYQYMYYGGKLLSHYSTNGEIKGLIDMLTINRNAVIVIDSDKRCRDAHLNDTKKRIEKEFNDRSMACWITKGKEIENYLSSVAVNSVHHSKLKQIGIYELFSEYIKTEDPSFTSHKVESARKYSEYITKADSKNILDIYEQIQELYNQIKKWNEAL